MESDNREAQNDEIVALQSIYTADELRVKEGIPTTGKFKAILALPFDSLSLELPDTAAIPKNLRHLAEEKDTNINHYIIKHLPPITLKFSLPEDYPLSSPPDLSLSCSWLGEEQLSEIKTKLLEEWDGDVVLFTWASSLIDDCWELTM